MYAKDKKIAQKSQNNRSSLLPKIMGSDSTKSIYSPIDQNLLLQRTLGNQAYGNMIQAKLKIGHPNDKYEQEADRVAEQVMRMPDSEIGSVSPGEEKIQRKCAACKSGGTTCPKCAEEEEKIQLKPLASQITPLVQRQTVPEEVLEDEEEEIIQAKATPANTPVVTPEIADNINALRGGGQPLPESTRRFFEPRFGQDFGGVRIHSDSNAAHLARGVNAQAFTTGSNIAFAQGKYEPETSSGKRLLAHELTHVVQQNSNRSKDIAQTKSLVTSAPLSLQRFLFPVSPTSLIGNLWLKLPRLLKTMLVDKAIEANLKNVDSFPGKALLGNVWIFMKEGLIGFFEKLKTAKEETKILVTDKIARIMAGKSSDYTLGLLIGLLKGFFIDGLLGIFLAIWGLIKGLRNLWSFFAAVGKLINGFPEEIANLIQGFRNLGQEISANIKPAIEEFKKFISDPSQAQALVTMIVEKGKSKAKEAGGKIAESLLSSFLKPGAEASVGEIAGRGVGMVLFEVVFAIITAGGGAAVTGVKVAAKFLAKIGGKILGSVLKVFRTLYELFGSAVDVVKRGASFLKGKVLGKITGKLGRLLEKVKIFISRILKSCRENSPIVCNFAKAILKAHEVTWKGFTIGKALIHFGKHGAEFSAKSVNKYLKLAKEFSKKTGAGIREHKVVNTIFKYEEATNTLFIGNAKGRHIKTFYKPNNGLAGYFEAIRKHIEVMRKVGK